MNGDGRMSWDNEIKKVAPETTKKPDDVHEEQLGPCCWIWVKGCKAIDIERPGEDVETYHYVHCGVKSSFAKDGSHFTLVFAGLEVWKIVVYGRNLRDVFCRIADQCVRRIRVGERDFGQTDKPFISKVDISDITPRD